MLDKNYKIEKGFIAEIPVRYRAAALNILGIEPLFIMLQWPQPGLLDRYFNDKPPQSEELRLVQTRIVLTKLTYFNPHTLDAESIESLLKLAAKMLDFPVVNAEKIAQLTAQTYPVFANWVLLANKLLMQGRAVPASSVKDSPDVDVDWCR